MGPSRACLPQLAEFTGRGWAIGRVRAWLDGGPGSALLIRGGPGTGKSLLAARLVVLLADAIGYAHFCRVNAPDTDPLYFVERLAAELANRYPAALHVLTADPSVSVVISGTAQAEQAAPGATLAGVQLGALHIQALAPRLAFNRTVRQAIEAIRAAGEADEVVVLVDGLDEGGAEPDSIAGLLRDLRHWRLGLRHRHHAMAFDRDTITGALALSPDGRLLAEAERTITVWDTVANRRAWRSPKLSSKVSDLAFSSDGALLLGNVGREIMVWAPDTGALIYSRKYEFPPSFAAFRSRQLVVNSDRTFYRYDPATGKLLGGVEVTRESEGAVLVAADPGGRWAGIRQVACAV